MSRHSPLLSRDPPAAHPVLHSVLHSLLSLPLIPPSLSNLL